MKLKSSILIGDFSIFAFMKKEVTTEAKIRFSDCDPIGHLNNVKYIEYMLNAREDHIEEFYGFTYDEYMRNTGCTWVAIQTEIAYLKEVRANAKVKITSKTIEMGERTSKVEIVMRTEDEQVVCAVLWMTVIYFNMKTRRSEIMSPETFQQFNKYVEETEQKLFSERALYFRQQNKLYFESQK